MRAALLLAAILCRALVGPAAAHELQPRAALIIDEADPSDGVPTTFSTTLRRALIEAQPHVAVYAETLDFTRFTGERQEAVLRSYLREKYHGVQFGAIVAVGASALELAIRWRPDLWRGTPIVFGAVDELSLSHIELEPGVTGLAMKRTLRSMVDAARLAVPGLKRVVVLGGTLQRDVYRRQYLKELPLLAEEIAVTNLTGQPLGEQLKHARDLPSDTAILYTSLFIDDVGTRYSSPEALAEIARVASRPIIVDVASLVGSGATGGFAINNVSYGEQVAALVLRVVGSADGAAIPVAVSEYTRPVFDRRQLERWRIDEASLPPGSEVRFQTPTAWEQYRWHIGVALFVILAQAALIAALFVQRYRRRHAELALQQQRAELAHAGRLATMGELTAAIAHEVSQPLGAILANVDAAEMLIEAQNARLEDVRQILADVRKDDLRASEVIRRLRALLAKHETTRERFDLNEAIAEVLRLLEAESHRRQVELETDLEPALPKMLGDRVHLQQVLLNLIVNAMDAMADTHVSLRRVTVRTGRSAEGGVEVAVSDRGHGIAPEALPKLFDSFFTTKRQGMGLGLSIARSIVEAHGGRIWAEPDLHGGATFRFALPAPTTARRTTLKERAA